MKQFEDILLNQPLEAARLAQDVAAPGVFRFRNPSASNVSTTASPTLSA